MNYLQTRLDVAVLVHGCSSLAAERMILVRGGCSLLAMRRALVHGGCSFATIALPFPTSLLHQTVGCIIAVDAVVAVVAVVATGVNAAVAAAVAAAGRFHPGVMTILVDRLQVKWSCLIDQVATDYIANVMTCHDIAVHVGLAIGAIKPTDLDLADKVLADRAFFGRVIFIDSDDDVAKGPGLKNTRVKSVNRS